MSKNKLLSLICLIIISAIQSIAQNTTPQIEGFWGVKLGGRESTVIQTVRKSYPSADYDKNITGHPFRATNVKLAGMDMASCQFTFEHGILAKASFYKSIGKRRLINNTQIQNYFNSLQSQFQSDYQEICETISEKYGNPKVTGQTVTWKSSNGNSITVKPWTSTVEHPDTYSNKGQSFVSMGIYIIYSKGEHLNDF